MDLKGNVLTLILILVLLSLLVQADSCGVGCSDCNLNSNNLLQCNQCVSGYTLNNTLSQCVYTNCEQNLFFQVNQSLSNDTLGSCVSICNPLYIGDSSTNACQQMTQCSSQFASQTNFLSTGLPSDFFIYQSAYYIVLEIGYLSIFSRDGVYLIGHLNFLAGDLNVLNVNGCITVITQNNSIAVWDVINETRQTLSLSPSVTVTQKTQLVSYLGQYMLMINNLSQITTMQIIYDCINLQSINSNQIQINNNGQAYQIFNDIFILFSSDNTSLSVSNIVLSSINNNLTLKLNQSITCQNSLNGSFLTLIETSQQGFYFIAFSNQILSLSTTSNICKSVFQQSNISKMKIIEINNNNSIEFHIILLTSSSSLLDYNVNTQKNTVFQINSQTIAVQDFEVGNFVGGNNEIAVLVSQQSILIFAYQVNQLNFSLLTQSTFQIVGVSSLKKMMTSYNNSITPESAVSYEIALLTQSAIQIIIQNKAQQLQSKVIENFNLPYPTQNSQVNSIALVYTPALLITCHQNGDFMFYDISQGVESKLIRKINYNQQACLSVSLLPNNLLAALTNTQLLLIDPAQQIILNQFSNLPSQVQMSTNSNYISLNYNNCIQIFSLSLQSQYLECGSTFSSNNLNFAMNNDLKIVIQQQNLLAVYSIDLQNQVSVFIQSIKFPNNINYFGITPLYNSQSDIINNNFSIDDILIYDNSYTFYIYDIKLNLSYSIQNMLFSLVKQAKRVVNDNSVYFLVGYTISANPIVRIAAISKSQSVFYKINCYPFSPYIDQPIKSTNAYGKTYYRIKHLMQMNPFTLHKEYMVDINRNITYVYGHGYVVGDTQQTQIKYLLGSNNNKVDYVGASSGFSYSQKLLQSSYTVLPTVNILSNSIPKDQILQVIQSPQLGIYFIRTTYQITSFNLFTNSFIEILSPQLSTDTPFNSYRLIDKNNKLVCWNSQQLLLVVYSYGGSNTKLYFKGMNAINGWIFDQNSAYLYIYGTSLQQFNTQLSLINTLSFLQSKQMYQSCKNSLQYLICSISTTSFQIINKSTGQLQSAVTVNGFTSQFQLILDEQYQTIYLFSVSVQVYSFLGIFVKSITISNGSINSANINSSFMTFFSSSYRSTLTLQPPIQAPSGLSILKYLYVDSLQQILLYVSNSLFAQIYVYNMFTQLLVGQMSGAFTINEVGIVVDFAYDSSSTYIQYIDTTGNYYIYGLFSGYSLQNNCKLTEVVDGNEVLVGLSYNNITNNVFVYSQTSLYQINYSVMGQTYLTSLNAAQNLFASIPVNNNVIDFLVFNRDNNIFRYTLLNMKFEMTLSDSSIQDIIYDSSTDTLILGLKDKMIFYQSYQVSINNQQIPQALSIQNISFFRFLQYNIYLTFDKKVMHFNIQTGAVLVTIQLNASVLVTSYTFNSQQNIILLGLSNGQLLQYNLSTQNYVYYTVTNTLGTNKSVIQIIINEISQTQQQAYIITSCGDSIQIDIINNKQLQAFNLITLVNEDSTLNLVDFQLDSKYSRYIFILSGEKYAYVWNFSTNQQEQKLILVNDWGNSLKINQNYIFTSNTFQINIYSLQQNISLITTIQRNNYLDTIMNYYLINTNIIAVFFTMKFEIFLLSANSNSLISQQYYNYPRLLGYIYNSQQNSLKVYGLHSHGVFENNYSINIYQNNLVTQCASLINNSNLSYIQQQIVSITPKQIEYYNINGRATQNMNNWINIIYLDIPGNQLSNINQFIASSSLSSSDVIIFSPQSQSNSLIINTNILQSFSQAVFQLSNYNLQFSSTNNQLTQFTLNPSVKSVVWQSLSISSAQLSNIEILITNVSSVILNEISIKSQLINSQQNQQNSLFSFSNVGSVTIYNLNISQNINSIGSEQPLFIFNNVQKVEINGITMTGNTNIASLFSFSLVANIQISNIIVSKNNVNLQNQRLRFLASNSQQIQKTNVGLFTFFGCTQTIIANSSINNNNNLVLIQSFNTFSQKNEYITLNTDQITISNITINTNTIQTNQLIVIQNSFVEIDSLSIEQNSGGFLINSAQSVLISKCTFIGNKAANGGALYLKGVQNLIQFSSSVFSGNAASSSGGALYLENINNCQITFDSATLITNNKALIGGGLRIVETDQNSLIIASNYPFSHNIRNNTAQIYGDNSATYPQQLIIQSFNTQSAYSFNFIDNSSQIPLMYKSQFSKLVEIDGFMSGQQLQLQIYIVDDQNRYLSFSKENIQQGIYPADIILELTSIQIIIDGLDSQTTQLVGAKIIDFNQYDTKQMSFILQDLQIQGTLQSFQYFSLSSNIYSRANNQNPVLMIIDFRACVIGEIIQQITQYIMICKECTQGTYSLNNPQTLYQDSLNNTNSQINQCLSCPQEADTCQGALIQVKEGYWRYDNSTDQIFECNQQINSCQPSNPDSINGCVEGYIGPLCIQCDILGEIWKKGQYSEGVELGQCQLCDELYIQWAYLLLKFIILIAYFIFTLKVFIDQFKYTSRCYYLRIMKMLPISKNSIQDYSGFYIKIIINYLQLCSLLIQQPNIIPVNMNFLNNVVGQTSRQLSIGIDCMVNKEIISSNGKVVFYAIAQMLLPLFILILITLIIKGASYIPSLKIRAHHYITVFHIFYTFFQLGQISYFSKSLTCFYVGNQGYNPYDVTVSCNDKETNNFVYPFSIIVLIVWSILPLGILHQLRKNKSKLNQCICRYHYGYFYGELKSSHYYWEFVRMYVKIAIIYLHIILDQKFQNTSLIAITIILCLYVQRVSKIQPFISKNITSSEISAYMIIIFKLLLSVILQDQGKTTYLRWKFIKNNLYAIIHTRATQHINTKTKVNTQDYGVYTSQQQQASPQLMFSDKLDQSEGKLILLSPLSPSSPIFNKKEQAQQKKQQKFQLLLQQQQQHHTNESNVQTKRLDEVMESVAQQFTEEQDPKKVESYIISPKLSVFTTQQSKILDTKGIEFTLL